MNIEGNNRNFESLSVTPSFSSVSGNGSKKNAMDTFNTVEWKNKNNGKTYVAKKLTLTENDKELTGVYVFEKGAKPDKDGKITGEFMSFDSFMQKMADELPSVNSSTAKAYFPNIHQREC